jgi:hypothetical protein
MCSWVLSRLVPECSKLLVIGTNVMHIPTVLSYNIFGNKVSLQTHNHCKGPVQYALSPCLKHHRSPRMLGPTCVNAEYVTEMQSVRYEVLAAVARIISLILPQSSESTSSKPLAYGGRTFFRNVSEILLDGMASFPRRQNYAKCNLVNISLYSFRVTWYDLLPC